MLMHNNGITTEIDSKAEIARLKRLGWTEVGAPPVGVVSSEVLEQDRAYLDEAFADLEKQQKQLHADRVALGEGQIQLAEELTLLDESRAKLEQAQEALAKERADFEATLPDPPVEVKQSKKGSKEAKK